MDEETPKRREVEPEGITCPDGIWSKEAIMLIVEKTAPEDIRKLTFREGAKKLLRCLLETPLIEVFTIDGLDGHKQNVARDYLRSRSAVEYFAKGFKPYSSDYYVSEENGEFYFINRQQFENFLADRPIVDASEIQQAGDMSPSYIPPYMQLMLEAVAALKLSQEKRTSKSVIVDWLRDNWPDDLDGKSDRLIDSMATLLRSPEHKKGGNTSWKE